VIKDPHFRLGFKSPISREQEEFDFSIKSKVKQIATLALKEGVDVIVISGDIFDIKETSRYVVKQLKPIGEQLDILKKATKQKMIITVAGNHDLPHSSRSLKSESVYDYFQSLGKIVSVHKSEIRFNTKKDTVVFSGLDFTSKLTELYKEMKEYDNNILEKATRVFLLHEHLLPNKDFNKDRFLGNKMSYKRVLKEFKNIDVFVAGHYHKGYKPYHDSNRWVVNPYNMTRLARDYYVVNGEHIPTVNLVKVKKGKIEVEEYPLEVVDFSKAIKSEVLEKEIQDSLNLKDFIEKLDLVLKSKTGKIEKIKLNVEQKKILEHFLEEAKTKIQK
jgi:DNA repair exonuclease SbcCD nuclease subunit